MRMKILSAVFALPAGMAVTAIASGATDWPTYQGDASHSGYTAESLDTSQFELRWQITAAGGANLNPITVGGGKVFVTDYGYFSNSGLYTYDAATGTHLWDIQFGDIFSANPPAFADGNVYVQTGNHSPGTYLRAYNADTGALVFQTAHAAQWERYYAPTIVDGIAYINGGYYGGMYAFNAQNGAQVWFHGLPQYDEWTPAVDSSLAYAYVGSYTPALYALDRATGNEVFRIPDPHFEWNGWSMDLAPVLGGAGDVLVIHDGRLIRFDLANRRIAWELQRNFTGQPSVAHGVIYALDSGALTAWDQLTGTLLWSWGLPATTLSGPMLVTDTHIFVASGNSVHAVDLSTHSSNWSFPKSGHLALADSTLYIASADGTLSAINVGAPPDEDMDGITDQLDNCPNMANEEQFDTDGDGTGDACNDALDSDSDNWADSFDNCPEITNADQANADTDEFGDVCDPYPESSDNLGVCLATMQDNSMELTRLRELTEQLQERLKDSDEDGVLDSSDHCAGTTGNTPVDATGCSITQFCGAITRVRFCKAADWNNNEALLGKDCKWDKAAGCIPAAGAQ